MGSQPTYKTNDAKVISEMLDGETILINLETGNYYSMNDSGSAVWSLLKAGATADRLRATLLRRFTVEEKVAARDAAVFLAGLIKDELIVEQAEAAADEGATPAPAEDSAERQPYEAPAMQKYEDMQQMLLDDPIHDVDEQGWPTLIKA